MNETSPPKSLTATFLRDAHVRCPICRYNLRGVESDVCPECGYGLRLTVAAPRAGFAWCLMGLIGLAITGWIVFRIVSLQIPKVISLIESPGLQSLVQRGFVPASDLPDWWRTIGGMTILLICMALMALIAGWRRKIILWPLRIQIPLAAILLFSPVIMLGLIALTT